MRYPDSFQRQQAGFRYRHMAGLPKGTLCPAHRLYLVTYHVGLFVALTLAQIGALSVLPLPPTFLFCPCHLAVLGICCLPHAIYGCMATD
jgi:hypothetical protein